MLKSSWRSGMHVGFTPDGHTTRAFHCRCWICTIHAAASYPSAILNSGMNLPFASFYSLLHQNTSSVVYFSTFTLFIINKVSIFNSVLMELVTFPLSAKKGRQLFPGWGLFCGVSLAVWQKIKPARNSSKAVLYGNCQYF